MMEQDRSRSYQARGVVLRHWAVGEADRILHLLTRERGLLRAAARGVRRPTSKLSGHLQPLAHVSVALYRRRDLDLVTEAQTLQAWRGLRRDLARLSAAMYAAEVAEGFAVEGTPNTALYDLLVETLARLDRGEDAPLALDWFQVRLLQDAGFMPELYSCVRCGAHLEPADHLFNPHQGGVLCPACLPPATRGLWPLPVDAMKLLRFLHRRPFEALGAYRLAPGLVDRVSSFLRAYVRHVLERDLRTGPFLDMVSRDAEGATRPPTARSSSPGSPS